MEQIIKQNTSAATKFLLQSEQHAISLASSRLLALMLAPSWFPSVVFLQGHSKPVSLFVCNGSWLVMKSTKSWKARLNTRKSVVCGKLEN